MFFLPDSPRWYAVRGRLDETQRVLNLSRGEAEATGEFTIISEHAKRDMAEDKGAALRDLKTYKWMRRTLWIGIGLATVQQATGINTVNYYAPTILESTGLGTSAALIATIAVGVTSVVMTIVGIVLLGKFNRRPLLLTGFAGVVGAQLILALSFLLPESTARSYLILGAMLLFVAFVQGFIGTLVWLLLSEIFPMAIRGFAMGIAVFFLWCVNAAISFVFPLLVEAAGATVTFAPVRGHQRRLVLLRQEVRARDPRPHPRGTRGRLPHPRRRAPGAHRARRRHRLLNRPTPDMTIERTSVTSHLDVLTIGRVGIDLYPLQDNVGSQGRADVLQVARRQPHQRRDRGGQARSPHRGDHPDRAGRLRRVRARGTDPVRGLRRVRLRGPGPADPAWRSARTTRRTTSRCSSTGCRPPPTW